MRKTGIKIAAVITFGLATLTACDPPMPPEVLAALAEQSYTCVEGVTEISLPVAIESLAADWQLSVNDSCPGMDITAAAAATEATELEVSAANFLGKPYAVVPFAVDAAVFAVTLDGIANVNLDSAAIAGILSKQIISWDDPAITSINPDYEFPTQPILLATTAKQVTIDAMKNWVDRLQGSPVDFGVIRPSEMDSSVGAEEGSIMLTSFSQAAMDGSTLVSILAGKSLEEEITLPDLASITAASTQWQITRTATAISVAIDPNQKVLAQDGFDVATNPYQAIFPVNLALVGTDSFKTRAAAKFLLRQDQQGALAGATMLNLPEIVRVEALALVSIGLPQPTAVPTN